MELLPQLPPELQSPGCSSLHVTYDAAPKPSNVRLHTCWNQTVAASMGFVAFPGDFNVVWDIALSDWGDAALADFNK
eukprot:1070448-Karenia_brevis.AAC.1